MNKINKKFGLTLSIALLSLFMSSLEAREYEYSEEGNVNINIIDREVTLNNEYIGTISSIEQVSVDEYEIEMDNDDTIEVEVEEGEIVIDDDVLMDSEMISSFFED